MIFNKIVTIITSFIYFTYITKIRYRRHVTYFALGAIGDTCYAMSFSEYILKNDSKCKFWVSSKLKDMILKSYPEIDTSHFVFYDINSIKGKLVSTVIFSRILCVYFKKNKLYVIYPTISYKMSDKIDFDFMSIICREIFKIGSLPHITYPYISPTIITSIDDFESKRDRIVVCNPYTNSMTMDNYIWEIIVEYLKSKGYIVYTNIVKGQKAIKGSLQLECDIFELASIAMKIPLIVSIRSGIIDYVVNTRCKKFVIFGDCKSERILDKTFYNIYNMDSWRKENIFQCNKKDQHAILDDLKLFMDQNNTSLPHSCPPLNE